MAVSAKKKGLLGLLADLEAEAPQKTVAPVASLPAALPAAPAAQQAAPGGASFADWAAGQPVQYTDSWQKGIGAAAKEIGYAGDIYSPEYRAAQSAFYSAPPTHDGGPSAEIGDVPVSYNADLLKALEGYSFQSQDGGKHTGVNVTDSAGQDVGSWNVGNTGSSFDNFAYQAIPAGIGLLAGAAMGGFIPGAEIGAAGSAGGTAAAGAAGAEAGALGLAEGVYGAGGALGVGVTPGTVGGLAGSTAGFGGLGSVLPASVGYGGAAAAGGAMGAGLLDMQPLTSPNLGGGLGVADTGLGTIGADATAFGGLPELNALAAGAPMETAFGAVALPAAASEAAPAIFNAAKDSQLTSQQLGITGAQSAAAATAPATVNLGSLGGTMGTAGGLQGLLAEAKQAMSGGLLGDASSWMKDNPMLGRLLMSGGTTLLSGAGGGSSSGGQAAAPVGPPVTWNSPLQQGLLSQPKQYAPPAIQQNKPQGLLAQGYANDGAWRYMGGR